MRGYKKWIVAVVTNVLKSDAALRLNASSWTEILWISGEPSAIRSIRRQLLLMTDLGRAQAMIIPGCRILQGSSLSRLLPILKMEKMHWLFQVEWQQLLLLWSFLSREITLLLMRISMEEASDFLTRSAKRTGLRILQ